ncbi:MAG: hypothetical protein JWL89_567 [Candidatus Saccharibacteria bacterium]|nr:hypothetical protein [Candidatus Saccharibacteria bacterium]
MATYKLIQDIEAEDHILGPLTLRQFIYALAAVFCFYISFILLTKHLAFLLILFVPPGLFCAFFAFPFGKDQSTELWALAKLRYYIKPRLRIWNQSGVKELVTITAPKKIERVLSDGLSQNEVESRLKALANTIDSRGWAIKNVNVNSFSQPDPTATISSDRLVDMSSLPQEVPTYDIQASDDMLDETSNPIAQQFDHMITASEQAHRQQLVDQMNAPTAPSQSPTNAGPPPDYWFMQQQAPASVAPGQAMFSNTQIVQPGSQDTVLPSSQADAADEATLDASLKAHSSAQHAPYDHLRTLQPLKNDPQAPTTPAATPSATPTDPAILNLANNNDLNVATIAREADKAKHGDDDAQNEVVIPLR